MSCYGGDNPVKTQEEGIAIWKWAKENGIDHGMTYDQIHKSINDYFFGGQAKPEWITQILAGRKTPLRPIAREVWQRQYNRKAVVDHAKMLSQRAALGPIGKAVMTMRFIPRSLTVAGHGIVFPVTHAGDLLLRPASWGTFTKGLLRTYRGAASSEYTARAMATIEQRPLYDLALRSGVDVGARSHPVGIISNTGGKTGFLGAAARAWDMLSLMRYELWEKQMGKYLKPGMTDAEMLDIGKNMAEWANHATGSAKGPVANLGGGTLFGPKLTQSKISRLTVDPAQTMKTFARWKEATPGEKAVAWTRLSGATQYLATLAGFLAVNKGVLSALGNKQDINLSEPQKGDWLAFKGAGVAGYVPGMHTEIRLLAKILNVWYTDSTVAGKRKANIRNPELHGDTKLAAVARTLGEYGLAKLEPGLQRVVEVGSGENWQGRPLPWSKSPGTEKKPKLTPGEYAASVGPIPLEGPIGFVYDHLKKNGASSVDAHAITKALIIFGGGLPGFHVKEDTEAKKD